MSFLKGVISPEEKILNLGTENPFSKTLREKGYEVTNTTGVDLDQDTSAVQSATFDVVTAFGVFEYMMSPYNLLKDIRARKLVASVPLKLWFASTYKNESDNKERYYDEFEDWQFDWLLEKSGWRIRKREKFANPVRKIGIRPILRRFTPKYYLVYAERKS